MSFKQKFLLLVIILIAVFFRFYQIEQMPGGLFPDEAANGLDINLMQQGQLQPFYERGNGREALFFYMEWGATALFGKGQWQFHVTSATVGVLSVIACFLVTREIFLLDVEEADEKAKKRAVNIGLLSAFLMAVSTWDVAINHVAFRANLIPLFAALTFYLLLLCYKAKNQKKRIWFALLTGAAFALGFYTYIAFRIMAPLLFGLLLWPLLGAARQHEFKEKVKKYFLPAVFFALAFLIVIFPIAKYFYQHPGSFVGRAGQVSVFNPELYTANGVQLHGRPPLGVVLSAVVEVAKTQLAGFFTHGDLNWRQNVSGFPFLSPLYSPFFGVGLALITFFGLVYFFSPAKNRKFWKYFLLACWFWGMLLPVITTAEGIPHGLRGIGDMPVVFIISAWVLYEFGGLIYSLHKKLWQHVLYHYKDPAWVKERQYVPPQMRLINFGLKLIVAVFGLALIFQTYYLYYVYAANSPEYYYAFRADLTDTSNYLRQRCDKAHTYLVLDSYWLQTTNYLTSDPKGNFTDKCSIPYQIVQPELAYQLSNLRAGDEIIFTQSTLFDATKFKQYHPEFYLMREDHNKLGQTIMAVYTTKN